MGQPAFRGAITALVTPFGADGGVDFDGLEKNIDFQLSQGISGVVPTGTTGESPTLTWEEHNKVIERTVARAAGRAFVLAGTGSNATHEAIEATQHARDAGATGSLLVDCYYNGPSSLELREEYYAAVAAAAPGFPLVPYVLPGRTGTVLLPEDLAILRHEHPQFAAVKEATGDLTRMKRTRQLCGPDLAILSGDDDITLKMMLDKAIAAAGVISVVTNVAPGAIAAMVAAAAAGDAKKAQDLGGRLTPLFKLVTVKVQSERRFPWGGSATVEDRFRNPSGIKTMLAGLGMPAGSFRRPLGKMTRAGVEIVRNALRVVWKESPEILKPIEPFYGIDIASRLSDDRGWESLAR